MVLKIASNTKAQPMLCFPDPHPLNASAFKTTHQTPTFDDDDVAKNDPRKKFTSL